MIRTAFVPGAGLGRRLRPLTERRPKPLVPVGNQPLITRVFDALIGAGIERFVVNTHHCAVAYAELVGPEYRGRCVDFIHEPVLLETGGGIRNARGLLGREPVLVHNGDVLADLNLRGLVEAHAAGGAEVTLLLRGRDGPLQVRYREGRAVDFRGALGVPDGADTLLTGAYVIEPEFVDRIPEGILSVVPVFLDMLRAGAPIAGLLDDSGTWADLGDRASYLEAHRRFGTRVDPSARLGAGVELRGFVTIGADAVVGGGAVIEDSVLWDGAEIASGARLRGCIVRDHCVASGTHADKDF